MTPLMLDIQALAEERDRARLGPGPLPHFARSLDDVKDSRAVVTLVGLAYQVYHDGEVARQIAWMMSPKSKGGDGPEYLEPRA